MAKTKPGPEKKYPHRINTRVTSEQYSHVKRQSKRQQITIAAFLRRLINRDMGRDED
jgi:predicted HicB family RNase H-like nuclease